MNPTNNESSGMQLPAPLEQLPAAAGSAEAPAASPEQAPAGQERGPTTAQSAPSTAIPAMLPPLPPMAPPMTPSNDVSATTPGTNIAIADDSDLIEKEWVHKAKAIVERTRDDPYKQSEELTVVKADYMKKRYGKTIKLNQ